MIEAKSKRKRKTKPGLKGWLTDIFRPIPFDFIAYLPLEECAARLESHDKHNWWRSMNTYVTITPVDDTIYDFTIKRERSKEVNVEAHGYLQDCEDGGTYVTGYVITSSMLPLVVLTVFSGIVWLNVFVHPVKMLLFFAGMGTIGIIGVFIQMHRRHELAEMIETTLGY
jgi:hypothetical protein